MHCYWLKYKTLQAILFNKDRQDLKMKEILLLIIKFFILYIGRSNILLFSNLSFSFSEHREYFLRTFDILLVTSGIFLVNLANNSCGELEYFPFICCFLYSFSRFWFISILCLNYSIEIIHLFLSFFYHSLSSCHFLLVLFFSFILLFPYLLFFYIFFSFLILFSQAV